MSELFRKLEEQGTEFVAEDSCAVEENSCLFLAVFEHLYVGDTLGNLSEKMKLLPVWFFHSSMVWARGIL